jgi:hypothetical protein
MDSRKRVAMGSDDSCTGKVGARGRRLVSRAGAIWGRRKRPPMRRAKERRVTFMGGIWRQGWDIYRARIQLARIFSSRSLGGEMIGRRRAVDA